MATINKNFKKLAGNYLFSEIAKRTKVFSEENPGVEILRLGIGNTTQPLPPTIIKGLLHGVKKLADVKTYTGYGDEQGDMRLREALSDRYKKLAVDIEPLEIFISDGAKPDSANIQSIFAADSVVAVADPVYPVYVDSNILADKKKIVYMPCTQGNGFIPSPPKTKVDLVYLCSPNNPTGAVMRRAQLKAFVDYANKFKAVIIFDAAYCEYIYDKSLPKSIYQIAGSQSCAIEINSFSKWAGFTGVRLGWTVVPTDLVLDGTKKGEVNALWNRRQTTMFNGASNIAQEGGLTVLSKNGQRECQKVIDYYMGNARIIRTSLIKMGFEVFGGENAPYLWLKIPHGFTSWGFFDKLLHQAHVVGTPGSGFGQNGEGYLRLSAFGHRENIKKALNSIKKNLKP
ncbi:LL-diaminopimelate aminotransferase [Candidatus Microgenomates bacterium]|nr:LL-diaminopimelate aminotransferase [Candidatus Microgenomates bacterium]